jgi:uncharacterized protein YcgI (DUF1989 family)
MKIINEPLIELPARSGCAIHLDQGMKLQVINTHGNQVVDTWALNAQNLNEYMSMAQTRRMLWKLRPQEGDLLFSNRRTPMIAIERDTSPGIHDTLFDCCDEWVYANYGCAPGHANCRDNFNQAIKDFTSEPIEASQPLNLWMNVTVDRDMKLSLVPPVSEPGDYVIFRALMDIYIILSACPMDVTPVNGEDCQPVEVHYCISKNE